MISSNSTGVSVCLGESTWKHIHPLPFHEGNGHLQNRSLNALTKERLKLPRDKFHNNIDFCLLWSCKGTQPFCSVPASVSSVTDSTFPHAVTALHHCQTSQAPCKDHLSPALSPICSDLLQQFSPLSLSSPPLLLGSSAVIPPTERLLWSLPIHGPICLLPFAA